MIPLRLTVKNFMCYRDNVPTLDLEGIHVACLCGDNGHGKTALLDAITWALWGQARARTQDELVHQGQQNMAVELEFLARGQRHRVSRRHSRSSARGGRQGATILELQVASEDGYRPITGNSVRETEAQIREILHMDYDTFINTAFLRQGDADRFTTSRPTERKERLAEVLDLSYYQALEERAKARSRALQEKIREVERTVALWEQEIARRPEHQAQLAAVTSILARVSPEAQSLRLKVEELRRALDSLQERRRQLEELTRRLVGGQRDVALLEGQVKGHEARIRDYEATLQREAEIGAGFVQLAERRGELERLDQALAARSELDKEKALLEREIAVQQERLSAQVAQLRNRVDRELKPRVERLPQIAEGLRTAGQERAELGVLEEKLRQQQGEAQEIAAKARDLKQANEALRREMEETRKKFDMLEQGDSLCPLCMQPLGAEGQEHLRREYEAHGLESKRRYQENASEQSALERQHKELAARLAQQEAEFRQGWQRNGHRVASLEREQSEAVKAREELQGALVGLQDAESLIVTEGFAPDQRQKLSQLSRLLSGSALGYDAERHRWAREQVKSLLGYEELRRRLQEAAASLPMEREALERSHQILGRRLQEVQESQRRRAELERELETVPLMASQLKDAQARLQPLEGQEQASLVQKAVLERELERCDALEAKLCLRKGDGDRLLDEKAIYDDLALAFGKNGIQALIIETAIPQLESDANELLGRLTENRMFLKLQLQEGRKDGRTGLPSEELDIKIADEVGTRSYETFSGGEAFRINFALRIALSKLLARRSGAPLPILFIDEGFGSQDTAGQERLTEAIRSIQNDFQKIIVITHIEQVKEAFPVRIEVTKTPSGSTFVVV